MWLAIASGIMAGAQSLVSDSFVATQAKLSEKMAKAGKELTRLAFERRSMYRNEEFAQENWNIEDRTKALLGTENAVRGSSNFDVSTGEQRINFDTLYRGYRKVSGNNRTEYLEFFEDEMSTINDILQYNYQAYVARTQRKLHSGLPSIGKALAVGIGEALGRYTPNGKKDKVSENILNKTSTKSFGPADKKISGTVSGVFKSPSPTYQSPTSYYGPYSAQLMPKMRGGIAFDD